MKKLTKICILPLLMTLSACDLSNLFSFDISIEENTSSDISNDSIEDRSSSFENSDSSEDKSSTINSKSSVSSKVVPLKSREEIRKNIGESFYVDFTVTTYDGIYNYKVNQYKDNLVTTYNDEEDNIYMENKEHNYLKYSFNEYMNAYCSLVNCNENIGFMSYLFDQRYEITEDAQYSKKEVVSFANRDATKYEVTNSKYILSTDKKVTFVLDNETGAILSLTSESIDFFVVNDFKPNNIDAKNVVENKFTNIPIKYWDVDALSLVGLESLAKPDLNEVGALLDL